MDAKGEMVYYHRTVLGSWISHLRWIRGEVARGLKEVKRGWRCLDVVKIGLWEDRVKESRRDLMRTWEVVGGFMKEGLKGLKIGLEWIEMEIIGEAYVVHTFRGYTAGVRVRVMVGDEERLLYISACSLSSGIEILRERNGGKWTGIRMRIRKEHGGKFAKYIVEPCW